jgi:hypothetical protein
MKKKWKRGTSNIFSQIKWHSRTKRLATVLLEQNRTRASAEKSALRGGTRDKKRKFTAVHSVVSAWRESRGQWSSEFPGLTRRRVVVKFMRVVGEDSSKYHRPKSPSGSRTSLRKVSGPNALRIKISSGPASPGRPRTHRKVLDLPTSEVRNSGDTSFSSRPWLPHFIHYLKDRLSFHVFYHLSFFIAFHFIYIQWLISSLSHWQLYIIHFWIKF